MGFKDWWRYQWSSFYIINKIEVSFKFYTQSGYEIMISKVIREIPSNLYNVLLQSSWEPYRKVEMELKEMLGDELNKICLARLNDLRKSKKIGSKTGVLFPGKFICKCVWDVDVKFRTATYEEYKKLKGGIKKY
jgi:hypothetical protein